MKVRDLLTLLSPVKDKKKRGISVTNMSDHFDQHFVVNEYGQTVNVEVVVGEHPDKIVTVYQLIDRLLQLNLDKAVIITCEELNISEANFEVTTDYGDNNLELIMDNYEELLNKKLGRLIYSSSSNKLP